jgi:hypothetical protein
MLCKELNLVTLNLSANVVKPSTMTLNSVVIVEFKGLKVLINDLVMASIRDSNNKKNLIV